MRATFGNFAGFVAGALMWISNVASSAGVAAAFAVRMANLLPWYAQRCRTRDCSLCCIYCCTR